MDKVKCGIRDAAERAMGGSRRAMEESMEEYRRKCEKLHKLMADYAREDVAVAFSGGVDSALLLKLAVLHGKEQGGRVYAITACTKLQPLEDEVLTAKVAEEIGAEHHILKVNQLEQAGIRDNPVDRCYRCKKYLFGAVMETAGRLGAKRVLEGTNMDDLSAYRPGLKAIEELGAVSPLKEAGFTKEQVRRLAKEQGISVALRPSSPCLATRFPYGARLTLEGLKAVEAGEAFLKILDLYNVRLRVHGDIARIEVDPVYLEKLLARKDEVAGRLKELGFRYITLDLEGFRSGSMDVALRGPSVRRQKGSGTAAEDACFTKLENSATL